MTTQYVAVFGDPVEGNPTSIMQNAAFEHAGLDWRYLDIRVTAADLGAAVQAARVLRFGGLNCTIPHKVAVIPLLDGLEPSSEISGAVNTIVRQPDGRLIGSNTDGSGFVWSIRDAGYDPAGLDVVILGAGGAARAVAVELALAGAKRVTIANRTAPNRDELVGILASKTSVEAVALPWEGTLAVPPCDVLVDCTPVGMGTGAAAEAHVDVDLSGLSTVTVVCDLNPETAESAFLRLATARGHRTLDGLGMLARQGAAGFKAWTGVDAPLEVMIKALGG
jgi:shikimate dehydrogenase